MKPMGVSRCALVLTGLLILLLVFVPPGGSVCWPLPGGLYLHIGWMDAAGNATLGRQVFLHGAEEPETDQRVDGIGSGTLTTTLTAAQHSALPAQLMWMLPAPTLVWLVGDQHLPRSRGGPAPGRLPPRQLGTI
jgi:hypothetical protein